MNMTLIEKSIFNLPVMCLHLSTLLDSAAPSRACNSERAPVSSRLRGMMESKPHLLYTTGRGADKPRLLYTTRRGADKPHLLYTTGMRADKPRLLHATGMGAGKPHLLYTTGMGADKLPLYNNTIPACNLSISYVFGHFNCFEES